MQLGGCNCQRGLLCPPFNRSWDGGRPPWRAGQSHGRTHDTLPSFLKLWQQYRCASRARPTLGRTGHAGQAGWGPLRAPMPRPRSALGRGDGGCHARAAARVTHRFCCELPRAYAFPPSTIDAPRRGSLAPPQVLLGLSPAGGPLRSFSRLCASGRCPSTRRGGRECGLWAAAARPPPLDERRCSSELASPAPMLMHTC